MRLALTSLAALLVSCAAAPAPAPAPVPVPVPAPAPAAVSLRESIVIVGKPAGTAVRTCRADGACDATYAFHVNGRGPSTASHLQLAADGTLAVFDSTGHDAFLQPVEEHFAITGKRAAWKGPLESG